METKHEDILRILGCPDVPRKIFEDVAASVSKVVDIENLTLNSQFP